MSGQIQSPSLTILRRMRGRRKKPMIPKTILKKGSEMSLKSSLPEKVSFSFGEAFSSEVAVHTFRP